MALSLIFTTRISTHMYALAQIRVLILVHMCAQCADKAQRPAARRHFRRAGSGGACAGLLFFLTAFLAAHCCMCPHTPTYVSFVSVSVSVSVSVAVSVSVSVSVSVHGYTRQCSARAAGAASSLT
jgi:hypothetical protein